MDPLVKMTRSPRRNPEKKVSEVRVEYNHNVSGVHVVFEDGAEFWASGQWLRAQFDFIWQKDEAKAAEEA